MDINQFGLIRELTATRATDGEGVKASLDFSMLAESIVPHINGASPLAIKVAKGSFDSFVITVQGIARKELTGAMDTKGKVTKEPADAATVEAWCKTRTIDNTPRGEGRDTGADVPEENRDAYRAGKAQEKVLRAQLKALRGKPAVNAKPKAGKVRKQA